MKHVEKSYSLPKPKSPIQIIPKPVPPSFLSVKRSDSFNQSDWNDCDIEITRHNTTVLENKTYMPTFDSSANFASTSQTNTILTAILTQIEDIKQTLKVHSAILQSLVQRDRGINASLCQLPEDIKLPILTYEDLLVMDQKLIDPLVKKYD
ncbi:uncharacterized protein LOC124810477 [Hydra vulgaris]|uniref:uncharacterized protein LOC124810477 n=1 Tax=Hydra vulgaris TaxID=6087 RepID=UPI0032EA78E5